MRSCSTVLLLLLALRPPSWAEAASADTEDKDKDKAGTLSEASMFATGSSRVPWRGSQLVLRNAVSAISLDPSAEQTYNPYYAMTWSLRPWWWFTDQYYIRANLDLVHELTEADDTTYQGELLLGDLGLTLGGSDLWTIPYIDVHLSASLVLTLPTSKASWARTLILGIGPGTRLSRSFALLEGLVLGYNLRVTPRLFRYTTSERETPLVPGCNTAGGSGCDAYLGTGVRNPALRLSQMVDASLRIVDWVGLSLVIGHAVDWLYSIGDSDLLPPPGGGQDNRYLTFFELTASFRPLNLLEIGVGYSALHPQLAPDSTYYVPFFNRYSVLFVDLKLHAEDLISRIRRIMR